MNDIFISYASDDRLRVEPLAKALEKLGWSVFWDVSIPVGKNWRQVIEEELLTAECVLVVWSSSSITKEWVLEEAELGRKRRILVPALIEDVDPPLGFGQIQAGRLINWKGESNAPEFENLVQAITTIVRPPKRVETPKLTEDEHGLVKAEGKNRISKKLTDSLGMNFVPIPAGRFMMGSKISSEELKQKYGELAFLRQLEYPQHPVQISKPFYIQTTVVTQGQWKNVMGNNPSKNIECGDRCPVEQVSWSEAMGFINKLNQIQENYKYRLPTNAEWEYACRAGSTTVFSFGDDPDKLDDYAWYEDNSDGRTHPVSQKKANAWGLYDMHGNVEEWFAERMDDPSVGGFSPRGEYCCPRGGSFLSPLFDVRCSRLGMLFHVLSPREDVGFRLVVELGS